MERASLVVAMLIMVGMGVLGYLIVTKIPELLAVLRWWPCPC